MCVCVCDSYVKCIARVHAHVHVHVHVHLHVHAHVTCTCTCHAHAHAHAHVHMHMHIHKSTAFRGFTETRTGACRRGDPGYGSTGSTAHPMTKLAPSGLESPTEPM